MKKIELSLKQIFLMLAGMILVYPLQANAWNGNGPIYDVPALTFEQHIIIQVMAWIYTLVVIALVVMIFLTYRKKKKSAYIYFAVAIAILAFIIAMVLFTWLIKSFSQLVYYKKASGSSRVFFIEYNYIP